MNKQVCANLEVNAHLSKSIEVCDRQSNFAIESNISVYILFSLTNSI